MTIFGSDVSHYDAADTRAMFSEGIVFQTHKAGGDANDAELASWWGYVKGYRNRVLLGAYWVLYPDRPASRADAFVARLDSQCPGWRDGPFILQADCERWNNDQSTVPSVSEVNVFCDRLTQLAPKLRPIGYLPDWVYGDISGFRYPLWSSKYVTGSGSFKSLYPGDSARQWAAYGGKAPSILQYSSSATIGGQTTCDANAYRGTLAELTNLLAPGWTTTKEDDVATLDSDDRTWFTTEMKRLLEKDGAVARGLRQQPNNLSDTERNASAGVTATEVVKRLTPIIQGVDTDEAAVISGVLAGLAGAEGAAETIAQAVIDRWPPEMATEVANQIMAKQGQAMLDAVDDGGQ